MIARLLCRIVGHRWRCLAMHTTEMNDRPWSTLSGWLCDRCGIQDSQQWDWP